jgi:hypothetical protein
VPPRSRARSHDDLDAVSGLDAAEARLRAIAAEPKTIRARGRGWAIAIPVGLLTALAAPVAASVQHFVALEREVAATRAIVSGYQESLAKIEQAQASQQRDTQALSQSVARLSGYLAGVLPKAGLRVEAEAGAADVPIESDPVPLAMAGRPSVRVRTPIPAPAPR